MSMTKADLLLEWKELSDLLAQSSLDAVALYDDLAIAEAERDGLQDRIDDALAVIRRGPLRDKEQTSEIRAILKGESDE